MYFPEIDNIVRKPLDFNAKFPLQQASKAKGSKEVRGQLLPPEIFWILTTKSPLLGDF